MQRLVDYEEGARSLSCRTAFRRVKGLPVELALGIREIGLVMTMATWIQAIPWLQVPWHSRDFLKSTPVSMSHVTDEIATQED
jgi:hypothetical protein